MRNGVYNKHYYKYWNWERWVVFCRVRSAIVGLCRQLSAIVGNDILH